MAHKTIQFPPDSYDAQADRSEQPIEIDLRNPWLAALLAWALPGLGHIYQGRTGKGLLFFICVLGTFIYGFSLGKGKVVYASVPGEPQYRWQYWCQLGTGLPAVPALVQRHRKLNHQEPLWAGFMAPPKMQPTETTDDSGHTSIQPDELGVWIVDSHPNFELGTVYTVIAGLLNILVICDAYAGPLVLAPRENRKGLDAVKKDDKK